MNTDNILRSANKYMKDMYDTFGGRSKEYMNAMKQVKENIPESVLEDTARQGLHYEGDSPDEPLQFSRSKASRAELEVFQTDLQELRKEQKKAGSSRKQSEKYYQDADTRGINREDINIKEEAEKLFDFDNSTNDWYDAIDNNPDIDKSEKQEIKDLFSDLFENYEDANFRDRLEKACRDILKKADERQEESAENKTDDVSEGFEISEDDLL